MAFDVKLVNGDVSFDASGRLELIRESDKVIQEVLKVVGTSISSDLFNADYGLSVTTSSIGRPLSDASVFGIVQIELRKQLDQLMKEQRYLATVQTLAPSERIKQIDNITVERDSSEPRQLNISIDLTLQSTEPITIQTMIST